MEHHVKLYPPSRFLNDKALGAEDANAKYYVPTLLFPFVITYIVFESLFASTFAFCYMVCMMYFVGTL